MTKLVGGSRGVIAARGSRRGRQESGRIATSRTEAGSPTIRHAGPAQVPRRPPDRARWWRRAHEAQREIDEEDASVASRIVPLTRPRPARGKIRCGAGRWVTDNEPCLRGRARLRSSGGRKKTGLSHRRERAEDSPSRRSASEVDLILRERTNERVPIRTDPKLMAATHTQRSAFGRTWSCECSGEAHGSRGIARSLAGSSPGVDLRDGVAGKSGFTGDGRVDTRVASVCRWRSRTG
jgi:hypothetical protein